MMDDDLAEQFRLSQQEVVVANVENRSRLMATGPDAKSFLHNFCTQDINRMQPGQGGEAFFCDVKGKTIGYGLVYISNDAVMIDTVAGQSQVLHDHLDRYLIREDVELKVLESELEWLAVVGPQADSLINAIVGFPAPQGFGISGEGPTYVCSAPNYGVPAWHVTCSQGNRDSLRKACVEAGAALGGAEILETLRIESGTPEFGRDFDSGNLPQELQRDAAAISFTKGCYLGQETVARLDAMGHVNQQLVLMQQQSGELQRGLELQHDGNPVGRLTSVARSVRAGSNIGLGIVRRIAATPGATLTAGQATATVIPFPMSD